MAFGRHDDGLGDHRRLPGRQRGAKVEPRRGPRGVVTIGVLLAAAEFSEQFFGVPVFELLRGGAAVAK